MVCKSNNSRPGIKPFGLFHGLANDNLMARMYTIEKTKSNG
jgi:hypothetical protein